MPKADKTNSLLDLRETNRVIDEKLREKSTLLMSQRRLMWRSFVAGIFTGLGGVIGATIGVAILATLLIKFGNLPIIGDYFETAGQRIQQGVKK